MTERFHATEHPWAIGSELPLHNESCMVCGTTSPSSPLIEPIRVRAIDEVGTRVVFDERHQGAPHFAHGGMVAAVLDDICGYVSFLVLQVFVTAHLEIDYRRPIKLGAEYDLRAWCSEIDGRKVLVRSELLDEQGVAAEAVGLFIVVDIEHFRP